LSEALSIWERPERLLVALVVSFTLGAALGCQRKQPPAPSDASVSLAPSASALPSPVSASAAAATASATARELQKAPCRAMRVTGTVRTEHGQELATQSALDGREWLDIGARSELVVRHGASARELSLHGPGRFLPCRSGLEQVLIGEGTLRSSPGTGVRPGAEVWVATPFGALRYADADLELVVTRLSLELKVRGGQAFAEAAAALKGPPDGHVKGPQGRASVRERPDASALVLACERAARAAESSAQRLLSAKPAELGQLAAAQLRSRRDARGHCLVAEASAAQLQDPAARSRLGDQLRDLEVLWQGIPVRSAEGTSPGR
jgi:hypothetical protein